MSRKSGNRFSEKDMRQSNEAGANPVNRDRASVVLVAGSADAIIGVLCRRLFQQVIEPFGVGL
jgi:hypothetical protein